MSALVLGAYQTTVLGTEQCHSGQEASEDWFLSPGAISSVQAVQHLPDKNQFLNSSSRNLFNQQISSLLYFVLLFTQW